MYVCFPISLFLAVIVANLSHVSSSQGRWLWIFLTALSYQNYALQSMWKNILVFQLFHSTYVFLCRLCTFFKVVFLFHFSNNIVLFIVNTKPTQPKACCGASHWVSVSVWSASLQGALSGTYINRTSHYMDALFQCNYMHMWDTQRHKFRKASLPKS